MYVVSGMLLYLHFDTNKRSYIWMNAELGLTVKLKSEMIKARKDRKKIKRNVETDRK